MIKIKNITTALLAMALMAACTPQAEELAATQPVTLMPTATIAQQGTAAVTRATTNEVGIILADGTLNLTMDDVEKEYTVGTGGALTTATPHKALVGSKHAFAVAEAKVTGTTTTGITNALPMNLNVAMTKQDLTVAAGGAVALPLAPTTAGMRLVLKTDEEVKPITVTCVPSREVAPKSGETTVNTDSRIVAMTEASLGTPGIYAVAFGMLPAGTKVDAGAPLATIEITGNKTLALLAPAPITLKAGEMVTYTVHVDHSLATITDVEIGGFTPVDGGSIGVGDNHIAMADGTNADETKLLTTSGKTIWVIKGNTADVLTNVKAALNVLNNTAAGTIDVILPEFAGTIGQDAFRGCRALTTINLPAAESIGQNAFRDCKALTTINLPAATSIDGYAFYNCDALTTISLPAATNIGERAFYNCTALTTISAPKATEIGNYAFRGCEALTTISLPAAKNIGNNAFNNCKALTTISLLAATSIGWEAFLDCEALTTISLPAAKTIEWGAFENCEALTTISLPAATAIGQNAFNGCKALTRLELTGTEAITVDSNAFGINSNTTSGITLVLNSEAQNQGNAMGISVNGKAVTFVTVTVIFSAVEYIN